MQLRPSLGKNIDQIGDSSGGGGSFPSNLGSGTQGQLIQYQGLTWTKTIILQDNLGGNLFDIQNRIFYGGYYSFEQTLISKNDNFSSIDTNNRTLNSSIGYTNLMYNQQGVIVLSNSSNTFTNSITSSPTANRSIIIQDGSGTLAFLNDVVGLWDDRGNYNASSNTFPSTGGSGTTGAILKGDIWTISVAGVLGGVNVGQGDTIRALTDTPGTITSNWAFGESVLNAVTLTGTQIITNKTLTSPIISTIINTGTLTLPTTTGTLALISGVPSLPTVNTLTSNTTLTYTGLLEQITLGNTSGSIFTTTLPSAIGHTGYKFIFKKIGTGTNIWTINTTSSQTIDGGLTATISVSNTSITLVSDGANWQII